MEPVSRVALLEWLEERRVEAEFKVSRILGNDVIVEDVKAIAPPAKVTGW